ncbi:MAG: hypothetical protein ABI912_12465, partial [Actinomycetota bacterium]
MRPLPAALRLEADSQDGLFTCRQARDAGLSPSTLDGGVGHRIQRVLPSVYAAFTGALTLQQRLRAAVLYGRIGGDHDVAILGALAACHLHGLPSARDVQVVTLLLPHERKLANNGFVVVRRTTNTGQIWRLSGLPLCAPGRAIIDATRSLDRVDHVRALVAEGVQRGKTTVGELAAALATGESAGSRLARSVLAEVADGVRSVAEAHLYSLVVGAKFPEPLWNADMYDASGSWAGCPDAIWPEANLIVEVESREWHLAPELWAATMKRNNRLSRLGYDVQQLPPSRIDSQPAA